MRSLGPLQHILIFEQHKSDFAVLRFWVPEFRSRRQCYSRSVTQESKEIFQIPRCHQFPYQQSRQGSPQQPRRHPLPQSTQLCCRIPDILPLFHNAEPISLVTTLPSRLIKSTNIGRSSSISWSVSSPNSQDSFRYVLY